MLARTILLLTVAAVAVDVAAAAVTCEEFTITGKGLCTDTITTKQCHDKDLMSVADTVALQEAASELMTADLCKAAQELACSDSTLTPVSSYCDKNGAYCASQKVGVNMYACSADADCDQTTMLVKNPKKMCCSAVRSGMTDVCDGYDSTMVDLAVDLSKELDLCADSDCASGASSLSISMALPAVLAAFSMLFARF
jgi:hypothetical protein